MLIVPFFRNSSHVSDVNTKQGDVVSWLLQNGVDREKQCYHSQRPVDVIGQCMYDEKAASQIREALRAELKRKYFRAPLLRKQNSWHWVLTVSEFVGCMCASAVA